MNDAVEIIGGEGIELAFKDLNINAKCTYKSKQLPFHAEVWEISTDDFKMLCDYPDKKWKEEWGGGGKVIVFITTIFIMIIP